MKKNLSVIIVLALVLSLSGCGTAPVNDNSAPFCSVTDLADETVSLSAPPERIVALSASDCEILFAVGAGEKLVGRSMYADYPAEAMGIPAVDEGGEVNIEQIISLDPDLVLVSGYNQSEDQISALRRAGLTVAYTDGKAGSGSIEGVYRVIALIAALSGCEENGRAVIDSMKAVFSQISNTSHSEDRSVYFEVSPLEYGLWSAGKATFIHEIAEIVGVKNIFEDTENFCAVSEEQVIDRDPDNIITLTVSYDGSDPAEEIMSRPGWEAVSAVKSGKVLNMPDNELTRPGPRLADAARMVSDFVWG